MPAGLGFMVQAILIFGIMRSESLLHLDAMSVWLSKGSLVFNGCMFCEVQLGLVVVSIVVLSHAILCPVVRKW